MSKTIKSNVSRNRDMIRDNAEYKNSRRLTQSEYEELFEGLNKAVQRAKERVDVDPSIYLWLR